MSRIEPRWSPHRGSDVGRWPGHPRSGGAGYEQNHGVPGVVYILHNEGLKAGYWKIGCTRRSGGTRASQLNADANTGTPGAFRCVFEQRTTDCGRAEQLVFQRLHAHRRGKWGQEFFEVELDLARRTITSVCAEIDGAHLHPVPPLRPDPPAVHVPFAPTHPSPRNTDSRGAAWIVILLVLFIMWVSTTRTSNTPAVRSNAAAPTASVSESSPRKQQQPVLRASKATKPLAEGHRERRSSVDGAHGADAAAGPESFIEQDVLDRPLDAQEGQETAVMSGLTQDERQSAESACSNARRTQGPSAYNDCLAAKVRELEEVPPVDLTGFSKGDVQLIQSLCSTDKALKGPAAYRACLARRALSLP